MKKILTAVLIIAASLALAACGPGEDTLNTGDGSVTSADIPVGTAPVISEDAPFTPDMTLPTAPAEEITEPTTEQSASEPETTPEATVTTPAENTTGTTSTTPKPTTTTEPTTTPAPATTPKEGEGQTEDAGDDEIIDNIDEFLASIGINEGSGLNAGE